MIYCSWDMAHDGCNYFSFWVIFWPFTPLKVSKIKIKKIWKKCLKILSFYASVPKIITICYNVPKIWCVTDVIVIFILAIFCPSTPKTPKINILKKWKKTPGDIIILHKCTKKFDEVMYISWDMVHGRRMDRQTDGWMDGKSDIEVGAPT